MATTVATSSNLGASPSSIQASGDLAEAGSNMYAHGQATGYGYPTFVYKEEEECDTGINPVLALGTIGLLLGASFFIFRQVTNPGMVRRRRSDEDVEENLRRDGSVLSLLDGTLIAG